MTPQGTLAERCRAGGAGIPAFYTHTGVDTLYELGGIPVKYKKGTKIPEILSPPKERRYFKGKPYLMEEAIRGDFALLKGWKADTTGNVIFRKTANNFNQDMGMAGKITIVEVEEIVQPGELNPDAIHLPGVFVHRLVKGEKYARKIEKLLFDNGNVVKDPNEKVEWNGANRDELIKKYSKVEQKKQSKKDIIRWKIGRRAAKEVKSGMYINLGIGMPTLVPDCLPADV